MRKFPSYIQHDQMDCGPACLKILAKHHGKNLSMKRLRDKCFVTREGVSLFDIGHAAEGLGFRTLAIKVDFKDLKEKMPLPAIIHWKQSHFVVIYKISNHKVFISDPAKGLIHYSYEAFQTAWEIKDGLGAILVVETTPDFLKLHETESSDSISYFLQYLKPHQKYLAQVFIGMVATIFIGLLSPFIHQSIVDFGIGGGNLNFVNTMLIAGLVLAVSSTASNIIQSRLMLYVSERVNMSMVSDFLRKILLLPIQFFERKMISDILTRVRDHNRIQSFIMNTFLGITVNILLFVIYGSLMFYYESNMFFVFLIGNFIYTGWIFLFLEKRKKLDDLLFAHRSTNSNDLLELLECVGDIKVNNINDKRRWKWELSRFRIYGLQVKNLNLNQIESSGALFIIQIQNITLTYIAASNVIKGTMTLGMMMAAQYVLGQLAGPISSMIDYVHSMQFTKLSIKRVNEIILEEKKEGSLANLNIPDYKSVVISNLDFRYNPTSDKALDNINVTIPEGKVTAIVGESGSGKSTLIKLLLRFYEYEEGTIEVGGYPLSSLDLNKWRSRCGAVLQEGRLFKDTILYNISLEEEEIDIDRERLNNAIATANIQNFINERPLKLYTPIGTNGAGLSQGQKQRVLIARAIYKNPDFLFLDEATNSLDTNNEKQIAKKLDAVFKDKTVVVIAHRLSTVKNAHNIIVLEKGKIAEQGQHDELIIKKGAYYQLVNNQLDI